MAKQCLYCGQPLAKEDARFCNECGQTQGPVSPPSSATAGPALIKVKLPPKELSTDENPFNQQERSRPNLAVPGTARTPQREQSASPSSRLPKRPVRLATQEPAGGAKELSGKFGESEKMKDFSSKGGESAEAKKISGKIGNSPAAPARLTSPARTELSLPAPSVAEETSTMVLSGWREELERVRKEQATASQPAQPARPSATTTEAAPIEPDIANPFASSARSSSPAIKDQPGWPQPSQSAELEPRKEPAQPKVPRKNVFPEPVQSDQIIETRTSPVEPPRHESRAKIWEQESTMQFPHISIEKEKPGPAPTVEHTPFMSIASDSDKQAGQIAQVETLHWEAFPSGPAQLQKSQQPTTTQDSKQALNRPKLETRQESKQPLAEKKQPPARDNQPATDKIEDQPTAHMAVLEAAQQQPGITIERTSTPAPTAWAPAPSEEVEDQPTRPMLASPAAPRSPFPPTAQQGSRGQAASLHAQSRQTFDPANLPPLPLNPASHPGTTVPGAGMQSTQQRSGDAFAQRPASFAPPSASWPGTPSASSESEKAKPRKKKRANGKRVLLILVVLIALVVLGGGAYYQYSSGGAQPYQSFQNSTLGVAFNYPDNWTVTVNQAQTSVHCADNNQTDQITLSATTVANGQQLSQYLTQESTQLGMTGTQTKPALTFAGTSWQEVQGSVTQKGVTNTLALYVTEHNNRFYALILQAPATTYTQIEQVDFKPLRNSFSFL